ncbi:MAG: YlmC/YmxH family sporulation protein [Clostridia bacterium]|nr:YlmC/YmxH family sporulation protein [Clostridia bacterium]
MEISFVDLKNKEVINIFDGKRLGHIIDITFEVPTGKVLGVVVPGIKKFMHKSEDIFIAIDNIKKIGEDVLLVRLGPEPKPEKQEQKQSPLAPYLKFRRSVKKES